LAHGRQVVGAVAGVPRARARVVRARGPELGQRMSVRMRREGGRALLA